MLKIVEIAKAWIAAANPTPEQQIIAEYRIQYVINVHIKIM